jgi:hypothetical protein
MKTKRWYRTYRILLYISTDSLFLPPVLKLQSIAWFYKTAYSAHAFVDLPEVMTYFRSKTGILLRNKSAIYIITSLHCPHWAACSTVSVKTEKRLILFLKIDIINLGLYALSRDSLPQSFLWTGSVFDFCLASTSSLACDQRKAPIENTHAVITSQNKL